MYFIILEVLKNVYRYNNIWNVYRYNNIWNKIFIGIRSLSFDVKASMTIEKCMTIQCLHGGMSRIFILINNFI